MTLEKIFLGGSKTIGHIPDKVTSVLELFTSENAHFLIGDCHGADLAIQTYLLSKGYKNVTVYCSGDKCRFNVGDWDVKHIPVGKECRGYSFYRAKDFAMIDECDAALMLWNGRTGGTKNNIDVLRQRGVPVFAYYSATDKLQVIRGRHTMAEKKYKIIVCGGRHFEDYTILEAIMKDYLDKNCIAPTDVEIVSGHCSGADMLGERYAKENGCALKVFPADWKKYGKAAGPIRNKQMVDHIAAAEKRLVIAFVSEHTTGTKNTVSLAKKAGIPVIERPYNV